MDRARIKQVLRLARRCPPSQLHDLYFEVYGADYGGAITDDRARISLREACEQLLGLDSITGTESSHAEEVPDITPTVMVQTGGTPEPKPGARSAARPRVKKPLRLEPL